MKNIHILLTDKPSRLVLDTINSTLYLTTTKDFGTKIMQFQNIYITSDEEIKEDWCYRDSGIVFKMTKELLEYYKSIEHTDTHKRYKIILTTDQDLIKDGVQAIDDEFLEWFVKNPSCEEVKIDDLTDYNYEPDYKFYGIIIPKEESKQKWDIDTCRYFDMEVGCEREKCICENISKEEHKQETLEEFVFKVPFNYNIKPKEVIDMCMKEQENIILTWRLGHFIDMINSLPDDTEKNRILKSVFNNRQGELLLESYKSMKLHYEK